MTSRRDLTTVMRRVRFALIALSSSLLGACAALPDDAPVVEQLDTETGTTVARLGRPIEVYRESFLQEPTGRFAFIAPFGCGLPGICMSGVTVRTQSIASIPRSRRKAA